LGVSQVAVIEARGLPKMDRFGSNDAYCVLNWNKLLERTSVKGTDRPCWNEEFR
jgi:Ca2+-dependent lipid-binding protein